MSTSQSNDVHILCRLTPRQKVALVHVSVSAFFCLLLMMGLPFLFLGCNPDIDNMCLAHKLVRGTAYAYELVPKVCYDCADSCDGKPCACGPAYTCYQGYVDLHYDGPDDNCTYTYHRKYDTQERAMNNLQKDYPLNSTHTFILEKEKDERGEKVCETLKRGMDIWIAGVVLLCLATCLLIVWIIYGYKTRQVARDLLAAILHYNTIQNNSHIPVDIWNESTIAPDSSANTPSTNAFNHSCYAAVRTDVEMSNITPAYATNASSYGGNYNTASVIPYPVSVSPTSVYVIPTAIVTGTNVNNNVDSAPGYPAYSTSGHY